MTITTLIIGPGRAGRALALAHRRAGQEVFLLGRREGEWQDWARAQGIQPILSWGEAPREAAFIILAVPDRAILEVARDAAASYAGNAKTFVHLSGMHDLDVLKPISLEGGFVAAMHPVMQFADPESDLATLRQAVVTETADPNAREGVLEVAEVWGAAPVRLKAGVDRRRYHLGLALASNHLTALLSWSAELLDPVFGADTFDVVAKMAAHALELAQRDGAAQALTGPVVRGDVETVQEHLSSLSQEEKRRYAGLLDLVVDLAEQGHRLPADAAERLRALAASAR
jgi:predicted short-subunit dehydrogenase-like oxidoreductase (DUF2520 family)